MPSLNNPLVPYAVVEDRSSDAVAHLAWRVRSQNTGCISGLFYLFMKKIKTLYNEIYEFGQLCKRNHLDSHSAAAAFFMFVSIFPFIILLLAIIPYTPITDVELLTIVQTLLPERLDSYATDIMNQLSDESLTLVSISAIGALWMSARSVQTIKQGLNEIYGVVETRNFIVIRINAIIYTFILLISVLVMLFMNVALIGINRYVREITGFSIIEKHDAVKILMMLRPFITIIITFIANMFFFIALPNVKVPKKMQIPGALAVSIIWYVFSGLFAFYINNFNAYSMYGSIAVVIIVLFWLYACMYILFIGAEFNYYLSLLQENNKI